MEEKVNAFIKMDYTGDVLRRTNEMMEGMMGKKTKKRDVVAQSADAYQERFGTLPGYGIGTPKKGSKNGRMGAKQEKKVRASLTRARKGKLKSPLLEGMDLTVDPTSTEGMKQRIAALEEKLADIEDRQKKCQHKWVADSVTPNQVECTVCGTMGVVSPFVAKAMKFGTGYLEGGDKEIG